MSHQDAQRIGLRLAVDRHADDRLYLAQLINLRDRFKRRIVNWRNAVFGRTTRKNVRQGDRMLGEVRLGLLVTPVIRFGRGLACPKTEECDYADNLFHIQTVRHSRFQMQVNPV